MKQQSICCHWLSGPGPMSGVETILGRSQCIETFFVAVFPWRKKRPRCEIFALGTAFVPPVGVLCSSK